MPNLPGTGYADDFGGTPQGHTTVNPPLGSGQPASGWADGDMRAIGKVAFQAGFQDPTQLATMIAIAMAESGGVANINNAGLNSNGTVDYGVWQINGVHQPDLNQIYDPQYNAAQAKRVFDMQGYGAWSVYNNERYLSWMDRARSVAAEIVGDRQMPQAAGSAYAGMDPKMAGKQVMAAMAKASRRLAGGGGVSGYEEALAVGEDDSDVADELDAGLATEKDPDRAVEMANQLLATVEPPEPVDEAMVAMLSPDGFDGIPQVTDAMVSEWLGRGLQAKAAKGAAIARALGFGGTVHGVGARGNKSDHPHGNAIDLMTLDDREYGQQLADFFHRFREELGVKYVIFNDMIATSWAKHGYAAWEWRPYVHPSGNTSNDTLAHRDHPHISFY